MQRKSVVVAGRASRPAGQQQVGHAPVEAGRFVSASGNVESELCAAGKRFGCEGRPDQPCFSDDRSNDSAMSQGGDQDRREYSSSRQPEFARAARRSGEATVSLARRSITVWRAMRHRVVRGQRPSELDYRQVGHSTDRFLLRRHKRKLDAAIRVESSYETMERRGLFDPLRHHQAYRAFRKAETPAQWRSRARPRVRRR